MPPSHINYFLSPLNSRCSYAWNFRESVNTSLLITLEKISLLRLFEADVVLLLDGGTSDRGSHKAGQALSKQFVSRPPPHSSRTTYSTRYFMQSVLLYTVYQREDKDIYQECKYRKNLTHMLHVLYFTNNEAQKFI